MVCMKSRTDAHKNSGKHTLNSCLCRHRNAKREIMGKLLEFITSLITCKAIVISGDTRNALLAILDNLWSIAFVVLSGNFILFKILKINSNFINF